MLNMNRFPSTHSAHLVAMPRRLLDSAVVDEPSRVSVAFPRVPAGPTRWLALLGILILVPAGVHAQDQEGEGEPETPADTIPLYDRELANDTIDPVPVSPVVVSVLRSPVDLAEAPFSVSAMGEESFQGIRSQTSLHRSLQGLPGIQVQDRFNDAVGERISVRGFGARSQFGIRGVQTVVDGIPATLPDGQSTLDHLDVGSLGRVEALRGPGSSLYGNAAGGVLSFETRRPADRAFSQEIEWLSADERHDRLQSTTSGQLGDTGYLLNLARYDTDGFRPHPDPAEGLYGGSTRDHVNAQVRHPLADGDLTVTGNYLDMDAENPGALTLEELNAGVLQAAPGNVNQRTGKTIQQAQAGVRWVGPWDDRVLELAGYGITRDLENPIPPTIIQLDRNALGIRGMLRGDRGTEDEQSFWWAVGAELDGQFDDRVNFDNDGGEPGLRELDQEERVVSGAVFAQVSLPINEFLGMMMGLRYDRIRFRAEDRLVGEDQPDDSGSRGMGSASPSLGIHADLDPAFGMYGNLSTAFETPTTTELVNEPDGAGGFNDELEPQVGFTGEMGARGILGHRLAYDVSYFYTRLQNELIGFEVPDHPGRTFFRNAGSSTRKGIETSIRMAPSTDLTAEVGYSYTRATFREHEFNGENLAGNRIPGLSPHRLHGTVEVTPGPMFARLTTEFVDAYPADDANSNDGWTPSYTVSDLRVGLENLSMGEFHVTPFVGVTNFTDQTYASAVTVNAFGGTFFEPGPPRSVFLGVQAGFGAR